MVERPRPLSITSSRAANIPTIQISLPGLEKHQSRRQGETINDEDSNRILTSSSRNGRSQTSWTRCMSRRLSSKATFSLWPTEQVLRTSTCGYVLSTLAAQVPLLTGQSEFILLLCPTLHGMLRARIPKLLDHPALLAHTIYQTIVFDDAVRAGGFSLQRTSLYAGADDEAKEWEGLAGVILREENWFQQWLAGEKKCRSIVSFCYHSAIIADVFQSLIVSCTRSSRRAMPGRSATMRRVPRTSRPRRDSGQPSLRARSSRSSSKLPVCAS